MELTPFHFVAAATVVAALITAIASLVSLVNSKEQKTTEFRQAWINSLRTEVANFQSQARYIAGAIHNAKRFDPNCFTRDSKAYETYAENRADMSNAYYLISLHFKPDDEDFKKLKILMESALDQLRKPGSLSFESINKTLEDTTREVRTVLKEEWERVKGGEKLYKLTKYLALGLAIAFSAIIVVGAITLGNSKLSFHKTNDISTLQPCATSVLVKCQTTSDPVNKPEKKSPKP